MSENWSEKGALKILFFDNEQLVVSDFPQINSIETLMSVA